MRLHRYSRCPSKFSPLPDLDSLLGVDVDLLCNDNDTDELGEMVLGNAYNNPSTISSVENNNNCYSKVFNQHL